MPDGRARRVGALVVDLMRGAAELDVPLEVNVAWGTPGPTPSRERSGPAVSYSHGCHRPDAAGTSIENSADETGRVTGSSRSPSTSARPTCGTRSRRARRRRSSSSSPRSGLCRAAGARRRLRARTPRPRARPRGMVVHGDRHQLSASSSSPARTRPPGATFERLDARALPFDAEFDAVICLCQGAFGLMTATVTTPPCWPAWPGRSARWTARPERVQRLLRGEVPRRRRRSTPRPASPTSAPRSATRRGRRSRSICGPAATRRASCACSLGRHGLVVDRISSVEPGAYGRRRRRWSRPSSSSWPTGVISTRHRPVTWRTVGRSEHCCDR